MVERKIRDMYELKCTYRTFIFFREVFIPVKIKAIGTSDRSDYKQVRI